MFLNNYVHFCLRTNNICTNDLFLYNFVKCRRKKLGRETVTEPVVLSSLVVSDVARQDKLNLFPRLATVKKYHEIRIQFSSAEHFIIDLKSSQEEIDSQVLRFVVLNCTVGKV